MFHWHRIGTQEQPAIIWLRNIIARSTNVNAKPNRDRAATIVFLFAEVCVLHEESTAVAYCNCSWVVCVEFWLGSTFTSPSESVLHQQLHWSMVMRSGTFSRSSAAARL